MIEIARYILAAIVAQTHLWSLGMEWTGEISVFAFYTLSGYLMTRVLNERYGFTMRGIGAFLLNRVLRLWPAYLVIMGLALIALRFLPLDNFFQLIRMPISPLEIITNLTVLGQVGFDYVQWLPLAKPLVTSWSLSIEIVSYLLLALYFAKSPSRLWAFAVLGVIAMAISTAWCATSPDPGAYGPYCFQNRYGVVQAGFIPFAFGGLYYFHRDPIADWIVRYRGRSVCLLGGALVTILATEPAMAVIGPMIGIPALATFSSARLTATIAPFVGIPLTWMLLSSAQDVRATSAQDFFGRASYHLFIAHMPIAAVLATGLHVPTRSISIYLATLAAALGVSVVLVPMERRINSVRQRVRLSAPTCSRPEESRGKERPCSARSQKFRQPEQ
jgi:peptidoglycan/LPS O-acetylase OafA/YrhL